MSRKKSTQNIESPPLTDEKLRLGAEIADHFYRKKYIQELRSYSWMPIADHREFAERLYSEKYLPVYEEPINENLMELNLLFMEGVRNVWGRALQPLGKLDDLAPIVSAIRSGGQKSTACGYLAPKVIQAFEDDDREFLKRVKKFSVAAYGNHRNHQIWVAIEALLETGNFAPSPFHSQACRELGIDMDVKWLPSTQEVKNYVIAQKQAGAKGFGNLPSASDPLGWARLWKDSGADLFLERLPRGRPCKIR